MAPLADDGVPIMPACRVGSQARSEYESTNSEATALLRVALEATHSAKLAELESSWQLKHAEFVSVRAQLEAKLQDVQVRHSKELESVKLRYEQEVSNMRLETSRYSTDADTQMQRARSTEDVLRQQLIAANADKDAAEKRIQALQDEVARERAAVYEATETMKTTVLQLTKQNSSARFGKCLVLALPWSHDSSLAVRSSAFPFSAEIATVKEQLVGKDDEIQHIQRMLDAAREECQQHATRYAALMDKVGRLFYPFTAPGVLTFVLSSCVLACVTSFAAERR